MSTTPSSEAAVLLEQLFAPMLRLRASDLHLTPGLPPYLRVEGPLEPVEGAPRVTAEQTQLIAAHLIAPRTLDDVRKTGALDTAATAHDGTRLRANVFLQQGQYVIAVRRLEDRYRSLNELGLDESLYNLCDLTDGLVVVAGPTGAGKSTTLAALIHRINLSRDCHVITIEDPIEYLHPSQRALVHQREIGSDAPDFNQALVASLRQDPDVILVGEIRDLHTIDTAITAAETGHLVFTTVHAGDSVAAIERMVAVFPADQQVGVRRQLALVLRAVIAQHLLVADGDRSDADQTGADTARRRVLAAEVLRVTPAVANQIAMAKSSQIYSAMETGFAHGMQTLEQCLARLLHKGDISERTALGMSRNPQSLRDQLRLLQAGPIAVAGRRRS